MRKVIAWTCILTGLALVAGSLFFGDWMRALAAKLLLRFHQESVNHIRRKIESPEATEDMVRAAKTLAEKHRAAARYEYNYTDLPAREIVKKLQELEL